MYLHCDQTIIDQDLFRQEVSPDSCFIASTEFLVDLAILLDRRPSHQGVGRDWDMHIDS